MRYLVLPLLCFALLALGGCGLDEAIARSEHAVATAQAAVERADAGLVQAGHAVEQAQAVLDQARTLATVAGSDRAAEAVTQASAALNQARAAVPAIQATASDARTALAAAQASLDAAKAAKNAGGSTWDVLLAILGTAVPALGAVGKLVGDVRQLRTAVKLTAAHADAVEQAETDDDVEKVKVVSIQSQEAAGVRTLIDNLRGA